MADWDCLGVAGSESYGEHQAKPEHGGAMNPPSAVVWGADGESLDLEPAPEDGPVVRVTWDAAGAAEVSLPDEQ